MRCLTPGLTATEGANSGRGLQGTLTPQSGSRKECCGPEQCPLWLQQLTVKEGRSDGHPTDYDGGGVLECAQEAGGGEEGEVPNS